MLAFQVLNLYSTQHQHGYQHRFAEGMPAYVKLLPINMLCYATLRFTVAGHCRPSWAGLPGVLRLGWAEHLRRSVVEPSSGPYCRQSAACPLCTSLGCLHTHVMSSAVVVASNCVPVACAGC